MDLAVAKPDVKVSGHTITDADEVNVLAAAKFSDLTAIEFGHGTVDGHKIIAFQMNVSCAHYVGNVVDGAIYLNDAVSVKVIGLYLVSLVSGDQVGGGRGNRIFIDGQMLIRREFTADNGDENDEGG